MTVGPPRMFHRALVGVVDLLRIVAAAAQTMQLVVAHVCDQSPAARDTCRRIPGGCIRRPWPCSSAYSPSTTSSIRFSSRPVLSRANSWSQSEPQTTLITFQPAPRKAASSSLMILPLPRTGPSSRCRLQLTTKIRLSSFSRGSQRQRAHGLGLVGFAVADERPHFARSFGNDAAILQVAHEARLVDRVQRAESHRDRREAPEVGHQPGMRIRRQARASSRSSWRKFFTCASLRRPSRKARAVNAGRGVSLEVNEVAGLIAVAGVEEMIEADFEQTWPATSRSRCGRRCRGLSCSGDAPWPSRSSGSGS